MKGEWKCECPSNPEFDTSMNPPFVSRCERCGASRPSEAKPDSSNGLDITIAYAEAVSNLAHPDARAELARLRRCEDTIPVYQKALQKIYDTTSDNLSAAIAEGVLSPKYVEENCDVAAHLDLPREKGEVE